MTGSTKTVTLRADGPDRWLHAPVLVLTFLPWLFAETVLVSVVLSAAMPIRVPEFLEKFVEGPPPPGPILFVLGIMTIVWTLVGFRMLTNILRLFLGRDDIDMTSQGLRVRRSIGPFGSTRELAKEDIHAIGIRGRSCKVVVQTGAGGSKSVVIASLGTEQQRRDLGAELMSRYRAKPEDREGGLPPEWVMTRLPDGTIQLEPPSNAGKAWTGCTATIAAIWCLLLGLSFLARGVRDEPLTPTVADWVLIVIGLALASLPFIAARSRETIEVRRHSMIITLRVGPWKFRREYRDASLHVAFLSSSKSEDSYKLQVGRGSKWTNLGAYNPDPAEPLMLGRFLARHTGWELEIDRQARAMAGLKSDGAPPRPRAEG